MRKNLSDHLFPAAVIVVAFAGAVVAAAGVVSLALGSPDAALMPFTGIGLLLIAGCMWVCFALTGGDPVWGPARRSCERIRAWHRREQEALRQDIMRHLASLSPEERAKEVERLTDGSSVITMDIPDKGSFLHPRHWPVGRVAAPDGLSD